jgi:serine/threonine protein kinase
MHLSDAALAHLQRIVDEPSLAGTPYRLVGLLGRGGMGAVWEVVDERLARAVALKVVDDPRGDSLGSASLRDEARTIARLEHPGLLPVHDVGRLADGRTYYVMKLVRGRRLDAWCAEHHALDERLVGFERIVQTVAFAHARGVVHRDLKPGNVMVGEFGEWLVLDWGLALIGSEREPEGSVVGTAGYMAPEQARGEVAATDARADVYALGRILAELLADAVPRPSRRLLAIAAKASAAEPAERYAAADALADDLARERAGRRVQALRETPLDWLARCHRRYAAAIWLVVAYLVMRVLAILVWPG